MAYLFPFPKFSATDANGDPLVGGKLYTYAAGTTTPLATYTDQGGGTSNANPVILDANGEANVWLSSSSYKFVLKDADDVTLWTVDDVTSGIATSQILDGALAASTEGRGKMASGFFGVNATSLAHFADGFWQATTDALGKFADGFLMNNSTGRAKMADGFLSADSSGRAKMADGFLTQAKLASRSTGTTVAAGGVAVSSSSSYSMSSTTYADVTNLSVTITTTGRPVMLFLISSDNTVNARIQAYRTGGEVAGLYIKFVRDSTDLAATNILSDVSSAGNSRASAPHGAFSHLDTPAAGTYTYKIQTRASDSSTTVEVFDAKLVAYEL